MWRTSTVTVTVETKMEEAGVVHSWVTAALRWQAVVCCSDTQSQCTVWQKEKHKKTNQFPLCYVHVRQPECFLKGNKPTQSDKRADSLALRLRLNPSALILMVEKSCHTPPLWFMAPFVSWTQLAYLHVCYHLESLWMCGGEGQGAKQISVPLSTGSLAPLGLSTVQAPRSHKGWLSIKVGINYLKEL